MMKKIIIGIILLLFLMVLTLYVTTKISKSHASAIDAIEKSGAVIEQTGKIKTIILLGLRGKDNSAFSCDVLQYLVVGEEKTVFLQLKNETNDPPERKWIVTEISIGYFSKIVLFELPKHTLKCR